LTSAGYLFMFAFLMRIAVRYDNYAYTIYIALIDDQGHRASYYTGIKIIETDWDKKNKRVRETNPDHEQLNRRIMEKYKEVEMMVTQNPMLRDSGSLSVLRKEEGQKKLPTTLNKFWDDYTYNTWRRGTKRFIDQRTFVGNLNKFDPDLFWNKISRLTVLDFDQWMITKGWADSTIRLNHQFLKTAIKTAIQKGLLPPEMNPYEGGLKFKYQSDTNNAVYLDDYEIKSIYELYLTGTKKIIRDYFVVSCYTAMDFSTISTLSKNSFYQKDKHRFIRIQRQKTKVNVIIPIHPVVEEIMKSYDYSLPRMPVQIRNYNTQIKAIAKAAGIKQLMSVTIKREEKIMEKWELVSSHTGRRSAATNMYLAGIPRMQIQLITGHRTEESFLKYIRISKQYNADLIAESKYFQKG